MVSVEWEIFPSPRKWGEVLGYQEDWIGFYRITPKGYKARPIEISDGKLVVDNSRFAEQRFRARERI